MAKKKNAVSTRIIAYQSFFKSPEGKLVLKDLVRQHHFGTPGFDPNPIELARMAGERNVVCYILAQLDVSEEQLMELMKEERDE